MNIQEFISNIDKQTLSIVLTVVITFIFIILLDLTTRIYKIKRRAKKKIKVEGPIVEDLEERFSIISNHASSYANSLGNEGAKLLAELKNIIDEQIQTLEMLQHHLETDGISEIQDYYKKYDELTPKQKAQWISRSNHLLQLLGSKIYEISERSTNLGIPKIKKRESTVETLRKWNILK